MENLKHKLRKFSEARDWAQFHSPKNLAMALGVEASEIVETFQWLTEKESYNLTGDRIRLIGAYIGPKIHLIHSSSFDPFSLFSTYSAIMRNINKKNIAHYCA
jgi:hypothetical protein